MDSHHPFKIEGLVAALSFIVVRLDDPFLLAPRDDAIDLPEKFLLVGCRLPQFVGRVDNVKCLFIRLFDICLAFVLFFRCAVFLIEFTHF